MFASHNGSDKARANQIAYDEELIDHATPVTKLLCRRAENIPIVANG
jgi:hypothetical protein